MSPEEKTPLTDVLQRARLIDRLMAASGLLAGQGWADSSKAVLTAVDMLRDLPIAEAVHKALQPDSMSQAEFTKAFPVIVKTLTPGQTTLREVSGRMREYVRGLPVVRALQGEYDGHLTTDEITKVLFPPKEILLDDHEGSTTD